MESQSLQAEREAWDDIVRTSPSEVIAEFDRHIASTPNEPLATRRQVDYLVGLRDGKDLSSLEPRQIEWLKGADFTTVTKARASDVIGQLVRLPWFKRDAAHDPDVKPGRYALAGADGVLRFYSVKQEEKRTLVRVWASDAQHPIRDSQARWAILQEIKADPDAGPRFGREIGSCYVCGRTLTDEKSRQLGIGPICRGEA